MTPVARAHRPKALAIDLDQPLTPALLRKLVKYREILDPPITLRDRQIWERQ